MGFALYRDAIRQLDVTEKDPVTDVHPRDIQLERLRNLRTTTYNLDLVRMHVRARADGGEGVEGRG